MSTSDFALSCCTDKTFVQDKVCTTWVIPAASTQTIYSDNIAQTISGSGYVKLETGTGPLTLTFLLNTVIVQTIIIPTSGSTTFSISRFDTITLTTTGVSQGEFCITVRYNL